MYFSYVHVFCRIKMTELYQCVTSKKLNTIKLCYMELFILATSLVRVSTKRRLKELKENHFDGWLR